MLQVVDIHANHGDSYTVQGISLAVERGACLGVLGRNGAGKTTLMQSVMGLHPSRAQRLVLDDRDLTGTSARERIRAGLALVPQGRRIFPTLSVEENLRVVPPSSAGRLDIADVYERFPRLRERRRNMGHQLSGGEQQMLAIGRALMSDPQYLLLDEPTEGLAPTIVAEVVDVIRQVVAEGRGVVLVEQGIQFVLDLADDVLVMDHGKVVLSGPSAQYRENSEPLLTHLGISTG
jgi:branched-chain amino acid transport system ATP-binding protein